MANIKKATFTLAIKGFSINKAYYRNRQLTKEARTWRQDCLIQLQAADIQKQFAELRDVFDRKKHYLSFSLTFFIPKSIFFANEGHISMRSQDVDNLVKLVTDNIFNKKYVTLIRELCQGKVSLHYVNRNLPFY